jgi:hypothetical protein
MKLKQLILVLGLLIATNNLFAQTNHPAKKFIGSYDAASQSNVDVIASGNMNDAVPCPPEYTNVISNTNLFSPAEQQLLKEAQSYLTNNTYSGPIIHHVRDKSGVGYDLYDDGLATGSGYGGVVVGSHEYSFIQIKNGVNDGLKVEIENDHCVQWLCYSNGWAVDKWLQWAPYGNKLILWAKFNEPFDIDRTHDQNLQAAAKMFRAWTNNALNAVPKKLPTSAEQLRSELETAVNNKDISTAISLVCWDGQDVEMKEMMAGMLAEELAKSGTNTVQLTLAPVPTNFQMTKSSFLPDWEGDNGMRGKYNLPVIGMIHVNYSGKNEINKYPDVPYGKKNDIFYVAQMVSYQIPGKALRVRVDNIGRSLTYTGYWTYVSSGKEITIPINDQTNEFREGWGDYVKYCYVQRTSTNETPGFAPFFQYKITEGQITNMFVGTHHFTEEVPVVIFDSGQITNEEPIIYERK